METREKGMNDFEGLFGLFGIMFGLIVAELSLKMADAIDYTRTADRYPDPSSRISRPHRRDEFLAFHLGGQKCAQSELAHGL